VLNPQGIVFCRGAYALKEKLFIAEIIGWLLMQQAGLADPTDCEAARNKERRVNGHVSTEYGPYAIQ
jgi:hypothetical protein